MAVVDFLPEELWMKYFIVHFTLIVYLVTFELKVVDPIYSLKMWDWIKTNGM